MKYMLLIQFGDAPAPDRPDEWAKLSEDERRQIYEDYQAINETPGVTPSDAWLEPPQTATTVRVENGEMLVTDGPFVAVRRRSPASCSTRPTTSTRRSSSRPGFRRPASAARSRSVR